MKFYIHRCISLTIIFNIFARNLCSVKATKQAAIYVTPIRGNYAPAFAKYGPNSPSTFYHFRNLHIPPKRYYVRAGFPACLCTTIPVIRPLYTHVDYYLKLVPKAPRTPVTSPATSTIDPDTSSTATEPPSSEQHDSKSVSSSESDVELVDIGELTEEGVMARK